MSVSSNDSAGALPAAPVASPVPVAPGTPCSIHGPTAGKVIRLAPGGPGDAAFRPSYDDVFNAKVCFVLFCFFFLIVWFTLLTACGRRD